MDSQRIEAAGSGRRRFLWFTGLGALGTAGAGGAAVMLDFVHPKVLFEPPSSFRVGRPESFPVNSVTADYARKVYLVRTEVGFFALSAVCTHLGCITRHVEEEGAIFCPCHGSKFAVDGSLLMGPATRGLRRIAIRLEDGELVVDSELEVEKDAVLRV
ncbi:MAG: ubiquinol-cytochrome c reductase iron-sulfur subunit [Candidatus Solibacter usitatus]|nr:ubiquinol-cytochrome c reductase iron-sulfur subunit [Candidatus Solibacter usitatus]